MRIVLVGAGGHGQVIADVLLASRRHGSECELVGYVDDNPSLLGRKFLGLPVLGRVDQLGLVPHEGVIVSIGDNDTRRSVFKLLEQLGERFAVAQHPSAVISPDVKIGPGTMICAGVVVNTGTTIGASVILNTGCSVDHHNLIGDHVHIAPGVHTGGTVTIGVGSLVGIGATIMPGRTIGANCVVGAASLVQRDVPDATMVVGVRARPVRKNVFSNSRKA